MSLERVKFLARRHLPQSDCVFEIFRGDGYAIRITPDCVIPTSRGETCAIRTETHAEDTFRMSLEGLEFLARRRVPQLDGVVPTSRSDARAIRAETHAFDRTRMPLEGLEFLARRRVPQPDCLIITSRSDARAIRAETHAGDKTRMPIERHIRTLELPTRQIPFEIPTLLRHPLQQLASVRHSIVVPPCLGQEVIGTSQRRFRFFPGCDGFLLRADGFGPLEVDPHRRHAGEHGNRQARRDPKTTQLANSGDA